MLELRPVDAALTLGNRGNLPPDQPAVPTLLARAAAAVVLAHNHPSGSAQPSRADQALTQSLEAALALVDVRVFDHVIVGGDQTFSMAERGLL